MVVFFTSTPPDAGCRPFRGKCLLRPCSGGRICTESSCSQRPVGSGQRSTRCRPKLDRLEIVAVVPPEYSWRLPGACRWPGRRSSCSQSHHGRIPGHTPRLLLLHSTCPFVATALSWRCPHWVAIRPGCGLRQSSRWSPSCFPDRPSLVPLKEYPPHSFLASSLDVDESSLIQQPDPWFPPERRFETRSLPREAKMSVVLLTSLIKRLRGLTPWDEDNVPYRGRGRQV